MRKNKRKTTVIMAMDFETTVDDDTRTQKETEVWSFASVKVRSKEEIEKGVPRATEKDVFHCGSVRDTFRFYEISKDNILGYFHNEKFDGSYLIDYAMQHPWKNGETDCWTFYDREEETAKAKTPAERNAASKKKAPAGTFEWLVSEFGQWYEIVFHYDDHDVKILDSSKLIPLSLKEAGKTFMTPHQKLEMNYKGNHYADCPITPEEMKYIDNDVLVLMECLETMFELGYDQLTIGSAAMHAFRDTISDAAWFDMFPDLSKMKIDKEYGADTADEYTRKAYKGGFCYTDPRFAGKIYEKKSIETNIDANPMKLVHLVPFVMDGVEFIGTTFDVNSLYPSVMIGDSGNRYPIGFPHFFKGKVPRDVMNDPEKYWFVRVRVAFELKEGHIPFIQIKGMNDMYTPNEMLRSSISKKGKSGTYLKKVKNEDGTTSVIPTKFDDTVEITLTMTDYKLMHEHYNVSRETILDGCWFYTDIGFFDDYINYWREIKKTSKGGKRFIAKRFQNSVYGKFATSPKGGHMRPVISDGHLVLQRKMGDYRNAVYIPVGAAITSYARNFTIRAAQMNYKYFAYADTDSMHLFCSPDMVKGIKIDDNEYLCWKAETSWDRATFIRQKSYVEHVTHENQTAVINMVDKETGNPKEPYYNVKCAGMSEDPKNYFIESIEETDEDAEKYRELYEETGDEVAKFLSTKRTLSDFNYGLVVPGKLASKRIKGGMLLVETTFSMRKKDE